MGCSSSAALKPENNMDSQKRSKLASKQRRKLSLAPNQVGDISPIGSPVAAVEDKISADTEPDVPSKVNGKSGEVKKTSKVQHASLSRKGLVPYNKNKVNQDRFVVKYCVGDDSGISLFAVMDGHGENGHFVAQFIQDNLPVLLGNQRELLRSDPEKAILTTVENLVVQLSQSGINAAFSGSTLVFGVKVDNVLYVGNVGDSRCVMCTASKDGSIQGKQLTTDHKPDNEKERERLKAAGARIDPLPRMEDDDDEDSGPLRVWLQDSEVPGLAMSRSIGDEIAQTVGVICVPEITVHNLQNEDLFAVWASDGVWEFMNAQQAAEIVHKYRGDLKEAARRLVDDSQRRWRSEEEVIDDISCVIVNFNSGK